MSTKTFRVSIPEGATLKQVQGLVNAELAKHDPTEMMNKKGIAVLMQEEFSGRHHPKKPKKPKRPKRKQLPKVS
jgi:hypothetical protein